MSAPLGVYICHCGQNIAANVDVPGLAEKLSGEPGFAVVRHYPYLCSKPGQELIKEDVRAGRAGRVVVAACSPRMHEATFRKAVASEGLNPYLFTHVNIREQCSWVHSDRERATEKAGELIRGGAGRVRLQEPLTGGTMAIVPKALVLGGGPAGLTAALTLADMGIPVTLVEREAETGGRAASFARTFPDGRPVGPWLDDLKKRLEANPLAEMLLNSEVTGLTGQPGNFEIEIKGPDGARRVAAGAVLLATGFSLYRPDDGVHGRPELGYGADSSIMTQEELDRLLGRCAGLPILFGRAIESAVFVQCVGSRDRTSGAAHCSRACCMTSVRQASELMERGLKDATVLYMDLRAYARGAEEAYEEAGRAGVSFRRGGVSEIHREGERRVVRFEDTLGGRPEAMPVDLVVLACGARPRPDAEEVGRLFGVGRGPDGFFQEAHPKLRPSETALDCVYLCGACQGPKTVGEAAQSGRAAAVKAAQVLLRGSLPVDPVVAVIDPERCARCGLCRETCPADAPFIPRPGLPMRINTGLCRGCGACASVCPSHAASLKHFRDVQILAELFSKA